MKESHAQTTYLSAKFLVKLHTMDIISEWFHNSKRSQHKQLQLTAFIRLFRIKDPITP